MLNLRAFNDRALMAAGWLIALIGFSLPISTAMDNVLLALMSIAFALSGRFREKLQSVRNPAVIALAGFFALLCLGTLYGNAPSADRLKYLLKYSDLLPAAKWLRGKTENATVFRLQITPGSSATGPTKGSVCRL
ncbi:MAG: hypothetical protein ACT4PQ_15275 [Betaproteobacteria bacterium]